MRMRCGSECRIVWHHVLPMEPDECSLVAHLVAIVRGRKNSDEETVVVHFIPPSLYLMRADDQVELVFLPERMEG